MCVKAMIKSTFILFVFFIVNKKETFSLFLQDIFELLLNIFMTFLWVFISVSISFLDCWHMDTGNTFSIQSRLWPNLFQTEPNTPTWIWPILSLHFMTNSSLFVNFSSTATLLSQEVAICYSLKIKYLFLHFSCISKESPKLPLYSSLYFPDNCLKSHVPSTILVML